MSEGTTDEIYDAQQDVVDAVQDVRHAVERVEDAVKERSSTFSSVIFVIVAVFVWELCGSAWHSKWRYGIQYGISTDRIVTDKKPHDCNFLASPIGEKYCHYEISVTSVRWATSTMGRPIVSVDDGKTWSEFTPDAGQTAPQQSTVHNVVISWEKKDD